MTQLSGAEMFDRLSAEEKAHYVETNRQMLGYALDHAIPLIIAPPVGLGEVKGATGSILKLAAEYYLLTASHVLAGYERRIREGENVYWQFGRLPPFDPRPRIVWRDPQADILVLRLEEDEVRNVGKCRISIPSSWPPPAPEPENLLLLAGYPAAIREVDARRIGSGPFSTLLRVASAGDDYCNCEIVHRDLVSFGDTPPPPARTDFGGISGAPAFLLRPDNCLLVGVITDHGGLFGAKELIRIATLRNVRFQ